MIRAAFKLRLVLSGLSLIWITACSKPAPVVGPSLQEAHRIYRNACQEFNPPAAVTFLNNTIWTYIPSEEPILELRASPGIPAPEIKGEPGQSLLYKKVSFTGGVIHVDYDINATRGYHEDPGYNNTYAESYIIKNQAWADALRRAYFEMGEGNEDKVPDFFVTVAVDVKRGVAIKTISSFSDLKGIHAPNPTLSQSEYVKRTVSEIFGNTDLIGDMTGTNLKKEEIQWPEFLAEQVENRLGFKYQQSDFKPSGDDHKEILSAVAETLRAYDYQNVSSIELRDLASGELTTYKKTDLPAVE
jgi:hypothetical protein